MLPKTSVLWLHYNSMHVIEITKRSLSALAQLDYPDFEIVLVDNGSSDGSRQIVEDYVKARFEGHVKFKLVKLTKNRGWTGGYNAAYEARDRSVKYVALTHNDLVPKPDYLKKLVTFLEAHKDAGAVQGLVVKLNDNLLIDSAGLMLNDALELFAPFKDKPVSLFSSPAYISYVEGTMPVYNAEAVERVLHDDCTLYITSGFIYFLEDVFVSLMLWDHGYKCAVLPFVTGAHYRMASSKKVFQSLRLSNYALRNHIALLCMINSAGKPRFLLKNIRRLVLGRGTISQRQALLDALIGGIRLGRQLRKKYGVINVYAAPLVQTPLRTRLRF